MAPMLEMLNDEHWREQLAREAYFADRMADVVVDREMDMTDARYFALDWPCVSAGMQRAYRTSVAVALDAVAAELKREAAA